MAKIRWDRIIMVLIVVAIVVFAAVAFKDLFSSKNNNSIANSNLDKTYMTVNGKNFTYAEVQAQYNQLNPQLQQQVSMQDFATSLVVPRELLLEQAHKEISGVNETLVNDTLSQIETQLQAQNQTLQAYLAATGQSMEQLRQQIIDQSLIEQLVDKNINSKINVTESEMRNFYEQNNLSAQNLTYNDTKPDIKNAIISQKQQQALQLYIQQLEASADIQYYFNATGTSATSNGNSGQQAQAPYSSSPSGQ